MSNEITDETLHAAVAALPKDIAPGRDLWPGIAARIAPPRRRWQPVAIAAAVAGLVAIGIIATTVDLHRQATPVVAANPGSTAPPRASAAMPALGARGQFIAATIRNSSSLDPKTQAVLLRNLGIIEASIANIQRALDQDPGNASLQPLLYQLYRDEAALVTAAQRVQLQHTTGVIAL